MADDKLTVRELADSGILAVHYKEASEDERRRLRTEAYELLYMIVFMQLTRRVELRRGHRDCAVSIGGLRPDCLDRFHDDMDAVLDDLFRNAQVPIWNLEGWVTPATGQRPPLTGTGVGGVPGARCNGREFRGGSAESCTMTKV